MREPDLSADLIVGVSRIAEFLGCTTRQAQHEINQRRLPVFMFRGKWSARRSTLRKHFEQLESSGGEAA